MLLVKTKLGQSAISGIGLFADEPIKAGTVVWEYNPKLDQLFTEEEIGQLSDVSKKQFHNYAYLDDHYGKYLLCGDDARFFNHSDTPNCLDNISEEKDVTIAGKDIAQGEELTCNYKAFYSNIGEHSEIR